MTLPRLWAFLAIALPTLAAAVAAMSTVDLTYQLRAGAQILAGDGIPSVDTWTFTATGLPWFDQQWSAQVVLAGVYQVAGWTGLVILRCGLVALIFGCLFEIGRRRDLGLRRAAWLTLAAFVVCAPALALRPQLGGMALFAATLLIVSDRRAHPTRLWAVPILVAVWANVHGSFFLGPLVLGLAWLEDVHDRIERPHPTLVVAVVSVAAACLTPFGPTVWGYAVGLSVNPSVTGRITEWLPTSLRDVAGILFFASVASVVVLIGRQGRVVSWPNLLWLAVFLGIGAYAARGIAWWALAAVPLVAALVSVQTPSTAAAPTARASETRLTRRLNVFVVGAFAVAGVVALPIWRPVDPATGAPEGVLREAPPGITTAVRAQVRPGARLYNPQPWGSWFEFAVPDLPVAIDSRIELFPAQVWTDYLDVLAGREGWSAILDRWAVTVAVVDDRDGDLAKRLASAGWTRTYDDEDGAVFTAPAR